MAIRKYTTYEIMNEGLAISPGLDRDEYYQEEFIKVSDLLEALKKKRIWTLKDLKEGL